MKTEIKYSKHIDLVFHALAHMYVNNASDCFDRSYIDIMEKRKTNTDFDLLSEINCLEQYYNDNFDRVMLINFLPFYSNSLDEMKEIYLNCSAFTDTDRDAFIRPFISLLDKEAAFYFDYWQGRYYETAYHRQSAESRLRKELDKYACIFDYFKKSVLAYLSFSITKNGRGFSGIGSRFTALAPFPVKEDDFDNTFFTLLHEYTHQFTDELLQAEINMADGTHDISENVVILADYYLIKAADHSSTERYLGWLADKSGNGHRKLSEADFLGIFRVDEGLRSRLLELVGAVTKS